METDNSTAPDWVRDAVFYQILPDRFANGDPDNDGVRARPFGSEPDLYHRQGGDLAGVLKHLDYLQDLGVNALYFNPIFTAHSYHGYDTSDYHCVSPHLGDNTLFKELVQRAHDRGWHVILDVALNHTGTGFKPFNSLRTEGERSPYRDWFYVHSFPIEIRQGQTSYEGWQGQQGMPILNLDNPDTRGYMLDVATRWLRLAHIDGWRLDSANELSHPFCKDLRRAVKEANPHAYIVGEVWTDARDWLQGDEYDAVTNYRWRGAALDFFVAGATSPTQFDAALAQVRNDYPSAVTDVMFNLLDSHDTERLRTLCGGDWRKQGQAVLFQMTYPGAPCIYYGDEIGLEGGKDPDNRAAMVWDDKKRDRSLESYYRRILKTRREHEVLRRGDYRTLCAEDGSGVFGFVRSQGMAHALALFNRSDQSQQASLALKDLGEEPLHDWLDSGASMETQGNRLLVTLPERGIALFGTDG